MTMSERELDELLRAVHATCPCEACERYRTYFAAKVAEYADELERMLGTAERRA